MQRAFGSTNILNITDHDLVQKEADLSRQQTELAKREGILEEKERSLSEKQRAIEQRLDQVEKLRRDLIGKLEKASSVSDEEAKKILIEQVEKDLAVEISKRIKDAENEIKLQSDEKAKEILSDAMLHGVTDYITEFTTSQINLPDEEMKGRIIGKEGRNIRAFEKATGVDVLMDDPLTGGLILSSFDPVRREIAKVALERLMKDGRIQPERIEEIVGRTRQDLEKIMCQAGEKLCTDVGVYDMPADIVCLLGRFKYRYSYGQNMIAHTLEETKIGVEIAKTLKADVHLVRLACLLHDIGKILTDWEEGTHVERGVQLAKKYNFDEKVINCIAEHHEDKPFSSIESVIVYIADSISGGRPGARHEDVQEYIKRIEDIERVAKTFDGVNEAYALSAGREVRVIVIPDQILDDELPKLTHDIAQAISKEVIVPGQIKVTAIRETRATDYATSG